MNRFFAAPLTTYLGVLLLPALAYSQTQVAYRTSTFAGTPRGLSDIPALELTLHTPIGLARDSQGILYVADYSNHRVLKIDTAGRSSVIAGTGAPGFTGNNGPAISAQLQYPRVLALDGDKYLYVGEPTIGRVRRIDLSTGTITHVLGDGQNRFNGDGSAGVATSVGEVLGLAVDSGSNLLFADTGNHRLRRLSAADSRVSTIAGTGSAGFSGDGGTPASAQLNRPAALALTASGDIYFTELGNGRIRLIRGQTISTVAGLPTSTTRVGLASQVRINNSIGLALSRNGSSLYFTDEDSDTVRVIDLASAQVTLLAGTGTQGYSGDGGPATQAQLNNPNHIVLDDSGGVIFADADNNRIRRIASGLINTVAGSKVLSIGDGGPATQANLNLPVSVKLDPLGNLIVADNGDCLVRRVDATGRIVTVAGTQGSCQIANLQAATADSAANVFWVTSGGLYVRTPADPPQGRQRVQLGFSDVVLSKDESTLYLLYSTSSSAIVYAVSRAAVLGTGIAAVGSVAGGNGLGSGGDGTNPSFRNVLFIPTGIALDTDGNLYILDVGNRNIRKVDVKTQLISTVLSNSGLASAKRLTIGLEGRISVSVGNQAVVYTAAGNLEGVVGSGQAGLSANGQDNFRTVFNSPVGVASTSDGVIYVADTQNHIVRKLAPVKPASLKAVPTTPPATGPIPVNVILTASDGAPLGGVNVDFAVSSAASKLSASSATTDDSGIASVSVTLGGESAVVTASKAGIPSVPITVSGSATIPGVPVISSAATLSAFGGGKTIAPGGWMEIFGSSFGTATAQWSGDDFVDGFGPTTLAGIQVTVSGKSAFLNYVSPGQINCVVPDGVDPGPASIVVTNAAGSSQPFSATIAARAPGLLAPPAFRSGARQYVVALFPDSTYAGPENLIAGAPFRPASAGERLILYGVGFGSVSPAVPAGKIAPQASTLPDVKVTFNDTPAVVEYAGVAPGLVGLYQIAVVTPSGLSGDVRFAVTVEGIAAQPDLWITLK